MLKTEIHLVEHIYITLKYHRKKKSDIDKSRKTLQSYKIIIQHIAQSSVDKKVSARKLFTSLFV